jgi:hypothetical protein
VTRTNPNKMNTQQWSTKVLVHDIDWELSHLQRTLERIAYDNIAPIPIAFALENGRWCIDVQVHVKGVTEYEVTAWDYDLATALSKINHALRYQERLHNNAEKNNALFGVKV